MFDILCVYTVFDILYVYTVFDILYVFTVFDILCVYLCTLGCNVHACVHILWTSRLLTGKNGWHLHWLFPRDVPAILVQ